MRLRKDDIVVVISGDERGKTGKILRLNRERETAIIEGVNFVWKHLRKSQQHPKGARVQREAPLRLSNLMVICQSCNKPAKIAYKKLEGGKKNVRICKKCSEAISPAV